MERDKEFWDELVEFIRAGSVVPIVGPELLVVRGESGPALYFDVVADRLADKLKLDRSAPGRNRLNDVVARHLARNGQASEVYKKIHAIASELPVEPPEALRQLAGITDFDLFVSLSFDLLLVKALNDERFGGAPRTLHRAYARNRDADIPDEPDPEVPVVFSLFGRHAITPQDFVVTDEDLLEFICALQSPDRRPSRLFDRLASSNIIFLGCQFPDWLARFVIRTTKTRQLSQSRNEWEYWVAPENVADRSFVLFLNQFSRVTRTIDCPPADFVQELAREWLTRRTSAPGPQSAPPDGLSEIGNRDESAVFISYASEDRSAAENIAAALRNSGIVVWMDRAKLGGGDDFRRRIQKGIERCSLFLPVISRNTQRRLEGYFRLEWNWADERRRMIADSVPFIVPVLIDDGVSYGDAEVPDSFKRIHWTAAPAGSIGDIDIQQLRNKVREHVAKHRRP